MKIQSFLSAPSYKHSTLHCHISYSMFTYSNDNKILVLTYGSLLIQAVENNMCVQKRIIENDNSSSFTTNIFLE